MLTMTAHPTAVTDDSVTNTSSTCRDRFGTVDVTTFRQRSCTLCYFYLFQSVSSLRPSSENFTHLVLSNGSDVAERYVVDSEDLASLDNVCRQFASDMGGSDGCSRWVRCCMKADECCRRQRRTADRRQQFISLLAPASCAATWDGFSCWDVTPAGAVVHQQCPEYMPRFEVSGLCDHHSVCYQLVSK